jgi:Carboxypeptidase regulatory-like domain
MLLQCRSLMPLLMIFAISMSSHALLTSDTGTIRGTVKDSTGAVLPRAQIKLQPGARTVASNSRGDYVIPDVAPGVCLSARK